MDERGTAERDYEECRRIIEECLLSRKPIPFSTENVSTSIDCVVVDHLKQSNGGRFMDDDVSLGPQIGGVSEKVLIDLAQSRRVFRGEAGTYQLRIKYDSHSVRLFEAVELN
jgi:hypothetical protein